ncbi:BLUF domain-containing protein [Acinetobacter sp. S40]|uniref:BLUF domain-containing protein n=1 Tax=unclassified Acinetobacter TaxID=196816 RepID=UPI00190B1D6D|nr:MULTISPECIES: BLUF domain-containing protein [unclassified Acinetobacter]MBJ9984413.1 BLUF domain-containing protein [Acinetobacter sp. S40]MBK0062130.1 BLUF domain-containing protein [Acinetobacter sp. S55]MBK0065934.1 BLUF domain-containing protein [Acinetobacter sp. S54]
MSLLNMLYASKTKNGHHQIQQDLMDILSEALNFNLENDITGVLYYGNGFFLHYLEGEKDKLEYLYYNFIYKDHRHKECEILFSSFIELRNFDKWTMKYAPINVKVKQFFKTQEIPNFNPYLINPLSIPALIQVIFDDQIRVANNYHSY